MTVSDPALGALRVTRWRVPDLRGAKAFGDIARAWGLAEVRAVGEVILRRDAESRDGWAD